MAENAVDRALAVFRTYEKKGVTGVTGPDTPKAFNDLAVVTRVTPCAAECVAGVTNNNLTNSSGRSSVTPVTPVTPEDNSPQKTANPVLFGYAVALDQLESGCPDYIEAERWHQCLADAQRFLAEWGDKATALGWAADDLFGLHPIPERRTPSYCRLARYDCTGLLWLLQGNKVVALTNTTATIRTPSGGAVTYRKQHKPALGPVGDSLDDFGVRP